MNPRLLCCVFVSWLFILGTDRVFAATLQVAAGAPALALPLGTVVCEAPGAGWTAAPGQSWVKPPAEAEVGRRTTLRIAARLNQCASESRPLHLRVTGKLPQIDRENVEFALDPGRLSIGGTGLLGMRVRWIGPAGARIQTCISPTESGRQTCELAIDQVLSADPAKLRFEIVPAGGLFGEGVVTFDEQGHSVDSAKLAFTPSRVLLSRQLDLQQNVDVSKGYGEVALHYPDAVASVECEGAKCELTSKNVRLREVGIGTKRVVVRARLLPRVFVVRGDKRDEVVVRKYDVVRCDLDIASGPPIRHAEEGKLLVRLEVACGEDSENLEWSVNGDRARIERTVSDAEGVWILLRVAPISEESATVAAAKPEDRSVVAFAVERTQDLPPVHSSLLLPGFGEIDFIPKNRSALVAVSAVPEGRLVPQPIAGVYTVEPAATGFSVRGAALASGYTSLRFAYRRESLPAVFESVSFGTFTDPVQRPLREANLPADIGASSLSAKPILELICATSPGTPERVLPGTRTHIPFSERDSCRLVIHRERLPEDSGEQLLEITASVQSAGGGERSEARLSERLLIRHGPGKEVIWIRGAKQQFDRISIVVTHVVDESAYLLRRTHRYRLPSAQWTIVAEDASLKFYATATIPSGLFRFSNDPQDLGTGPLALNFGVLSRLTLLNEEGQESLIGLESGVMGMGLATEKQRQLAIVGGLGVGVPLGNVNQSIQASLNIHAWAAYSLGERTGQLVDEQGAAIGRVKLNPWAFVFGPSITIGSIAAFL